MNSISFFIAAKIQKRFNSINSHSSLNDAILLNLIYLYSIAILPVAIEYKSMSIIAQLSLLQRLRHIRKVYIQKSALQSSCGLA